MVMYRLVVCGQDMIWYRRPSTGITAEITVALYYQALTSQEKGVTDPKHMLETC